MVLYTYNVHKVVLCTYNVRKVKLLKDCDEADVDVDNITKATIGARTSKYLNADHNLDSEDHPYTQGRSINNPYNGLQYPLKYLFGNNVQTAYLANSTEFN